MKIVYFLHTASATDGSSKAFIHLIEKMISIGVCPLVILPRHGDMCLFLEKRNIKYIILHWEVRPSTYPWMQTFKDKLLFIPRLFGRLFVNTFATLQSIYIVHKFQPRIIHSNTSVLAIGYYTASFLNIPHIWHIREYGALDFNYYYYYPSRKKQLQRYKQKDSYSISITKDIQQYNALAEWRNSKVIYDGVLSVNMTHYQSNKDNYFLFVGSLSKAKGVLPLIRAYADYCKNIDYPLPLFIAGDGSDEYKQQILDVLNKSRITDQVTLLGLTKDVLPLYQKAKALIVPSLSEGFGFITAEAMFSGCLVIGNNTAGTKEQFDNGKEITGEEIALRYTTQEQLVQHLIDVTNNNTDYYEPMILRAQQVVAQLYSTESHAENVYNFYKEILANQ